MQEPSLRLPGAHPPGPPFPGLAHSLCGGQRSALPCSQVLKQPCQGLRVPSTSRQAPADAPSRDSLLRWSSLVAAHCDPVNSCTGKESGNQQLGGCPETPGAGSCSCILGQSEGKAAELRAAGAGPTSALRLPLALLSLCVGVGASSCSPGAWRTVPEGEMGFPGARVWVGQTAQMVSVTGLLKLQFGPSRGASVDRSRANGRRGVSGAGRTFGARGVSEFAGLWGGGGRWRGEV